MGVGAGHHHLAGLQRAAQAVQSLDAELGQLVEEQHPVMSQGDLAGLGLQAAAGQGGHAGAVVRGAIGPRPGQGSLGDQAGDRMDHRGLEQLGRGQGRQQAGQALGQHRLARARRADEQQVVAAGGGDLQGPLGLFLALDVAQVAGAVALDHWPGRRGRQDLQAAEMVDQRDQGARGQDPGAARPGRLGPAGLGTDQAQPHGPGRHRGGQGAGCGGDAAVQGELAHGRPVVQGVQRDYPHGRHHRQGDGQVIVRALLGQVGRGQVGDDTLARQGQAQARKGAAHPLAAFGHRLVAQAHDDELVLTGGQLDLDVDAARLDPFERNRDDLGGHVRVSVQLHLSTIEP